MRIATMDYIDSVFEMDYGENNTDTDKVGLLKSPVNVCYINEEETAMFAYAPIVAGVWQCHILSCKEARGKAMQDFAYDTAVDMVKSNGMKSLFVFVPRTNRANRLFVSYFGLRKKVTTADCAIYHAESDTIINFRKE